MSQSLVAINPTLDRAALAARFAMDSRVQIRDVLTEQSAHALRHVLQHDTPWGFAYKGGATPAKYSESEVRALSAEQRRAIANDISHTAAAGRYAVRFNQYPVLDAYLEQWRPGSPHDLLIEHINDTPFLDLVRSVTGIPELIKADAQATLFGPGDFLSIHADGHVAEGWRIAYVLNLADADWRPDWGGYLNFFDGDDDIIAGWKPRFNALNLLAVPQPHNVSYVPPFARSTRFAVTGWFRDR